MVALFIPYNYGIAQFKLDTCVQQNHMCLTDFAEPLVSGSRADYMACKSA